MCIHMRLTGSLKNSYQRQSLIFTNHAFLKYPKFVIFNPYMKSTHFENFSKRTPAFAGVVGGVFL